MSDARGQWGLATYDVSGAKKIRGWSYNGTTNDTIEAEIEEQSNRR